MLHCNPEFLHVVRPKTPRGDGNHRGSPALDHAPLVVSSDPKPREGTETRKRRASSDRLLVVRPKTPRGDGNSRRGMARQAWLGGRQTQNPERGRKHFDDNSLTTNFQSRQTQNPERGRKHIPRVTAGAHHSSSRQTQNPERGRKPISGTATLREDTPSRQTQNPERGRKLHHASCHQSASSSSSDPKPREGTET